MPNVELYLKLQNKLNISSETRIDFYRKLFQKIDGCQGYLVEQKNTADNEEIVVLATDEKFIIMAGNIPFSSHSSLDEAILISFGLHVILKKKFNRTCIRTAHFLQEISEINFQFVDKDPSVDDKVSLFRQ